MGRKNIHKFSWTYQGLLTLGWIYHRIYYRRFTLAGKENIPRHAPVIFALNHQNALMDPLAIIFAQVRQVVFFARADIFRKKFIARILYFLKILPVYRPRDGFRSVEKNQGMFQEAIKVLKKNRTVGILPEANHVGKKRLRHLHKGAARLALQAEEQSGFQLGLRIIPVGIDYSHYFTPGADLLVVIGKPIIIKDYQEKYLENTPQAINQLTKDLAGALKKVILHIEPLEDYTALHQAIEFSTPPFIRRNNISHGIYRSFQTKQLMAERFNTLCEKGDNRIQQLISDSREYTGQLRQLK